jgi:hypothetical protein
MEWVDLMSQSDKSPEASRLFWGKWLEWGGTNVYVRWTHHREIAGRPVFSLDLANIHVAHQLRGRGWFRTFIQLLKKVSPTDGIYIESASHVANPWMRKTLRSWGFDEVFPEDYWFDLRPKQK